jgi:sporulation related protein
MSYQQFGHVERDERIDYAEEEPPHDQYPPRRGIFGAVLAVAVMAVFAGGLWFAYHQGAKHAQLTASDADKVPLIRADPEPVKVKPDKAGGMDVPGRDNPIYAMRPGQQRLEKLLPPPEAPAPRPVAPPPQAAAPAPGPASAPAQHLLTPQQIAALAKPGAKAPAPDASATQPAAAAGGIRIQLASVRSADAAREEWTRLKRDNEDLLGKYTAVAVRADLGERGIYYRVEAGPIGDKAAAQRLCKALRERDLECRLVR